MGTEKRRMGQSAVVIADPGTLVGQYAQPIPARTNRAERRRALRKAWRALRRKTGYRMPLGATDPIYKEVYG